MPRPPASPEQRNEQRNRIRRAAADLYAEQGPRGVTVRAVAKGAGVSTGTLYSYFDNLQAIMRSLWTGPVAEVGRKLEAVAQNHPDPEERVRALLHGYADFARDEPEIHRGAMMFVRPGSVAAPERQPAEELPFYRLVREAIDDGQADGSFRAGDPAVHAQTLWAGVHGALALPVHMDAYEIQPAAALVASMIDALVGSLLAPRS